MKKSIKAKKLTLNIDKIYKNDFNLIKIIAQTKKMKNNNKTLEARKNNLKELLIEINNEYQLNKNPSKKNLQESNANFHTEYELFNKRTNKKETKIIFKDLVKLYKSKGYRIPNFSIETHNLFKINPLLEANTDMISNGLLESQISKKGDDSEKIIKYLKKLGIILSGRMSRDTNLQKNLMKKFNIPKFKVVINEEDTIENLKKKIEIITNLINTNALSKLDEPKKRRYRNISRQNSYVSMNYSNKKLYLLNKERNPMSRRPSNYNNRVLNLGGNITNNFFLERKNSIDSSASNTSIISNNNYMKKINNDKSSETLNKIFNFTSYANNAGLNFSKTPRALNIPITNFQRANKKNDTNTSDISAIEKIKTLKIMTTLTSKQNNLLNNFNINRSRSSKKNILNYKSQTNNNRYFKNKMTNLPFFIKTQSNNESINSYSDEFLFDSKSPKSPKEIGKNSIGCTDRKKNDSHSYPYSNKNEFINFAFNKFTKRNIRNAEKYIKNYLNKIKGYDNEKIENFVNDIYDKNIKYNIKDLEKQITDYDLYYKTERLYLNSHLIKRIKPLLNSMGERDKQIYRLEKNLTDAVAK